MYLAYLMVVPLVIGLVALAFSKGKITLKELAVMEGVVLAVLAAGYAIARYNSTADTEIISGRVLSKKSNRVSCSHPYPCNCRLECTGYGKSESCSEKCDTCYEHPYDVDWDVYFSGGLHGQSIDRIDSQGLEMPPRWAAVYKDEPASQEHQFTNYIKANPDTLLRRKVDLSRYTVPPYPNKTYDYYRVNRFLAVGYTEPQAAAWNWLLNQVNADEGPRRQANVIVVAVKTRDQAYEYALQDAWVLGKKNDVIVLLGVPDYPKIEWARVLSWSKAEDLKVELRDDILQIGDMQRMDDIVATIKDHVDRQFVRRHGKDFEYLMASMQPDKGVTIFLFLLGIVLTGGLGIYMYNNDGLGFYMYNNDGLGEE